MKWLIDLGISAFMKMVTISLTFIQKLCIYGTHIILT